MTRGVQAPSDYYYRRLYIDAARAISVASELPGIDSERVIAHGVSQGGGVALAAAALEPHVAAVLADVPFLSNFRRAVGLATDGPYLEIENYLAVHRNAIESTFNTLDYFDGVFFAARSNCPALFSVALQDQVCPPSVVYSSFNSYKGPKEISVYPFNGHEGGAPYQWEKQIAFLRSHGIVG